MNTRLPGEGTGRFEAEAVEGKRLGLEDEKG
jgi:hypothetical protein